MTDQPDLGDFDRYCLQNNIQPDELGAAFGAWLNLTTGWDGDQRKIDP